MLAHTDTNSNSEQSLITSLSSGSVISTPVREIKNKDCTKPMRMQRRTQAAKDANVVFNREDSLVNQKGPIPSACYREKIYTDIKITPLKVLFTPFQFDEKTASPIVIKTMPRDTFYKNTVGEIEILKSQPLESFVGIVSLSTDTNIWVPLRSISLKDELVYIDEESLQESIKNGIKIDIRPAQETRQYFAKLIQEGEIKSTAPVVIKLHYAITPTFIQVQCIQEIKPIALNEIRIAIEHIAIDNIKLQNLLVSLKNQTIKRKITILKKYCGSDPNTGFQPKEKDNELYRFIKMMLLEIDIKNDDIHFIMYCICDQAGVCAQRSRIFMILANYVDIPTRVNANKTHAFVEYFNGKQWVLFFNKFSQNLEDSSVTQGMTNCLENNPNLTSNNAEVTDNPEESVSSDIISPSALSSKKTGYSSQDQLSNTATTNNTAGNTTSDTLSQNNEAEKLIAFRKIYRALRDSQSGLNIIKSNFLKGKETSLTSEEIEKHISESPNGRTAKAWDLAKIHYPACNQNNIALFKEIHQWSFKQRFYSKSRLFGSWCNAIFKKETLENAFKENETILQARVRSHSSSDSTTRTAIIYNRLSA